MKSIAWIPMLLVTVLAGCGDNSKQCGDGTVDKDGTCVASGTCGAGTKQDMTTGQCVPDGSIVCADGTMLDVTSGMCVVDMSACQDGTVLIAHQCVDPGKVVADVEEGPEPNGYGLIEASNAQAGTIALKAVGMPFVIHGKIDPFRDASGDGQLDPDVDTYLLTVAAPTLLDISADGLHGVTAGFLGVASVGSSDPLFSWTRFGLSTTGDTSKREVYLPRAGAYLLAIADSRTLFQYSTGGPTDAAPGGANGDYYVSIEVKDLPTPTALVVTSGSGAISGTIDGETVQFYAVPMGTGLNDVQLAMPSDQANASIVVANNASLRATADEQVTFAGSVPAEVVVGNIAAGDTTLVIVDATYNYAAAPVAYDLAVFTTSATALSTTGQQVTATATAKNGNDFTKLNEFYFDISTADANEGVVISWAQPIVGQVYDDSGTRAAAFSSPFSSAATWTDYTGLLRLRRPGRYYFVVFDPTATPGTSSLAVTSQLATLTADAIALGTPLAKNLDTTFLSNPFLYEAGTAQAWQQFDVTGTSTGGQRVQWYDVASAYGRLDTLTTSATTSQSEVTPIFSQTFTTTGGAFGRILLDDPTTHYYVKVNPTSPSGTPSATLSFAARPDVHDFGTINGGQTASLTGEQLDTTVGARFYLYRTANGNPTTITVHPGASLDTQLQRLQKTEAPLGPTVDSGATPGADDATTFFQTGNGWTAFEVSSVTPVASAQTFDVTIAPQAAKRYTVAAWTTGFSDLCGAGTPVVFPNDPSGDEDLSLPIAAPTGFLFYGQSAPQFVVSTNGFLSFDTTLADPAPFNGDLPDPFAPPALVAPYWTDLYNVSACTQLVGQKLVIQWTGQLRFGPLQNTNVQMQVVLDPADESIQFIYGAGHEETGDNATIGIQDPVGVGFTRLGFDQHGAITVPGAPKLTPM